LRNVAARIRARESARKFLQTTPIDVTVISITTTGTQAKARLD
jgi:hypothetical protein